MLNSNGLIFPGKNRADELLTACLALRLYPPSTCLTYRPSPPNTCLTYRLTPPNTCPTYHLSLPYLLSPLPPVPCCLFPLPPVPPTACLTDCLSPLLHVSLTACLPLIPVSPTTCLTYHLSRLPSVTACPSPPVSHTAWCRAGCCLGASLCNV